jgi:hypothetical protein
VPKRRKNAPDRRATRRTATGDSARSAGLRLAPAAEQTDDLEVVLDPGLAPADLVGDVASEMVRAVAAARTPLDAELAVSLVLGMLERMAPEDATPGQQAAMVQDFLTGAIDWAQAQASPATLAFLRVAAVLGPPATRRLAGSAADQVAAGGVPDRPWASRLGRPDLIRAWWYGDVRGEQESVTLHYDYHHREHTLSVLIDHQLGGGVKDCWIGEGRQIRGLRDRTAAQMADTPGTLFEDVDTARAEQVLSAALTHPPCPVQDDQIEDVTIHLEILRSRVSVLAGPPN